MTSQTFFKQLWYFIRDNFKQIIALALVMAALIAGLLFFVTNKTPTVTEEAAEKVQYMENMEQKPSEFSFYVENKAFGDAMQNAYLYEEIFTSDAYVAKIKEATGIDLVPILTYEDEAAIVKNQFNRGAIGFIRNTSTNVITAYLKVGTEAENLKLAQYFYQELMAGDLEINKNKLLYSISEPKLSSEVNPIVDPTTQASLESSEPSGLNIPVLLVIAAVFGLFAATVLIFAWQFMKRKLSYAFTFSWNEADIYIPLSKKTPNDLVKYAIEMPRDKSKLLLSQAGTLSQLNGTEAIESEHSLEKMTGPVMPELCILLLESNQTDKEWYYTQRVLLENFPNTQIKIIHLV